MTVQPDQELVFMISGVKVKGITLVELVITIVVLSVGLTGILAVINLTDKQSANPLLTHQAIAIAESYLEEILLHDYSDPDGIDTGETRATFDDVIDYDGLVDVGSHDQLNNLINGLASFTISIDVVGPLSLTDGMNAFQVNVTVSKMGISNITLVGYKFAS